MSSAEASDAGRTPSRQVPAIVAAMRVLDLVAEKGPMRGNQIRVGLGLNASTCHDTIKTLAAGGYLECSSSTRKYGLGPVLKALGVKAYSQEDLIRAAQVPMRAWVNETGFSVFLARALPDLSSVIIDRLESSKRVRLTVEVGHRFEATAGAVGKAFCAYADDWSRILTPEHFGEYTPNSIRDPDLWREELGRVRESGWAESRGEYFGGGNAVVAPIFGPANEVVAVIGSLAWVNELTVEELPTYGAAMRRTADEVAENVARQNFSGLH